jgi:hypothetical protein
MSGIMQSALGNWKVSSAAPAVTSLIYNLDAAALGGLPGSTITTSASFNGTNQQLSVPANAGFDFGTGDFTIECWMYATSLKTSDLYLQFPTEESYIFFGPANASGAMRFNVNNGPIYDPFATVTTANSLISINTWYHVALMRSGDTLSLFIDGVCRGTASGVAAFSIGGSTSEITIGGGGNYFPGYISNFRVVKGSTVYAYGTTVGTTYFTPPTTTLRAISGTQLLLPLSGTPFMDLSPNLLAVTNTNTVATATSAPALTTGTTDLTGTYTITSSLPVATFTGSITGTTLTVSGVTGTITTGMTVTGGSVPAGTYIVSGSGSTWTVSASVTQGSTSMTGARINWFGTQGGIFSNYFSGDGINAFITGGPNIPSSTSYTVMMAYKLNNGLTANYGRLLNSDTDNPDFIMGGYSNYPKVYFSNGVSINLTGAARDTVWHIDFVTFNGTSLGNVFSSTSVQPTATPTYTATNASIRGFNQLQLYSKSDGNECAAGDIGMVKVWNGVLTTAQMQTEYNAYKARFGY